MSNELNMWLTSGLISPPTSSYKHTHYCGPFVSWLSSSVVEIHAHLALIALSPYNELCTVTLSPTANFSESCTAIRRHQRGLCRYR